MRPIPNYEPARRLASYPTRVNQHNIMNQLSFSFLREHRKRATTYNTFCVDTQSANFLRTTYSSYDTQAARQPANMIHGTQDGRLVTKLGVPSEIVG